MLSAAILPLVGRNATIRRSNTSREYGQYVTTWGEVAAPDDVVNPDLVAQLDTDGVVVKAPHFVVANITCLLWFCRAPLTLTF
jgi:hypothetical protein